LVRDQMTRFDTEFPIAAAIALDLIQRAEVGEHWLKPSALPKMSIGALACHLGRQVTRAAELLPMETNVPPLDSVDAHYQRSAWVTTTSPDDPPNDRSTDNTEAAQGWAALKDRTAEALEKVRGLLATGAARDVISIPWQGWSLRRGDFLHTRMLEIVVHADDLAISLNVPTPEFPAEVFTPVSDLLVRLAVKRHGQSALISALTRTERPQLISAF